MDPSTEAVVTAIGKLSFVVACSAVTVAVTLLTVAYKIERAINRHSFLRK